MKFAQPKTTQEALTLLASDNWSLVSGGTDFYPALGAAQPTGNVLDISRLSTLRAIHDDKTHWHIGALATWTDIINARLPDAFNALKLAALEVGSVQIQNRATLVGNICNASPAADGIPALLCLDTIVRVSSSDSVRDVALQNFVTGNRQTALDAGEMVIDLLIPKVSARGKSNFLKLGARKYLVISIAMVASRLAVDSRNTIVDAALSVGSCSVVAQRLPKLEQALIGQSLTANLSTTVAHCHVSGLTAIDDVRATAGYRHESAAELLRRSIDSLVGEP
ncbi:MAG: FAD binding domain-containing protein [Granulosicoccaceae bacterium]